MSMHENDFKGIFCEALPVIEKAAPTIFGLIGTPVVGTIVGILAAVSGANACDHAGIADKLKNDPDLYTKLANLEASHAEWLSRKN